ncbi:RING finger protein 225 [Alligator mississippiensis]|uniref:RING finger protein 225 n=1 Tax=Alligator mississippiensis TaxID=8496 RepID=UPI000906FA9C|nr:RING finger protein 225 [Alligator mississippiensis]
MAEERPGAMQAPEDQEQQWPDLQGAGGPEEEQEEEDTPPDCIICFMPYDRLFKVPKALGCGHAFCLECLARINVSSEEVNAVSCPVCRELTRLPHRKGLPGLPTRYDLLEQLPSVPGAPKGSIRFSRRKGLLYMLGGNGGHGGNQGWAWGRAPALPKPGSTLNTISLSVDVGRPEPRVAGRSLRRLSITSWPFCVAVAVAIVVTVGLIACGVYIFFWLPGVYNMAVPGPGFSNFTWMLPPRPKINSTLTNHTLVPPTRH